MLQKYSQIQLIAGTDEAGRGCLAGPVTAAAVILPLDFFNELLNDSKQLSEHKRTLLEPIIKSTALSYGISHVPESKIDEINILHASILGMHLSIDQLRIRPEHIIVDGNKFKPYPNISHECIVKGDAKFLCIAAASILAKTARDEYMNQIHQEYPMYQWNKNKG